MSAIRIAFVEASESESIEQDETLPRPVIADLRDLFEDGLPRWRYASSGVLLDRGAVEALFGLVFGELPGACDLLPSRIGSSDPGYPWRSNVGLG